MPTRIIVVGHGMVGQRFLESLTKDGTPDFAITMLAEEPRLAYDRVNLTKYFSGSSVEDLTLTNREFFDRHAIELHSGDAVASVVVLGLICTAIAFLIFFRLIAEIGPSRASIITYVNPVVALALGVAILGEHVTTGAVCGLTCAGPRPGGARDRSDP